jgi:gamma-D-glutamyl-L-lysine dipeptidyl-peptidase
MPDMARHVRRTIAELIAAARSEYVPDFRSGVFDVHIEQKAGGLALVGQATHPAGVRELIHRLAARGIPVTDAVIRLPDASFGAAPCALVRAALAPVYAEPLLPAPQISQLVLGMRVQLLSADGDWLRIRGEDGYIGWVHGGYLRAGPDEWAYAWERGAGGEPVVSLGAELEDDDGRTLSRLPWGARIVRHSGSLLLPDGRRGRVAHGEIVDVDRLADRFPPRGESVARTARRWLGAPYVWGGVTPGGVDCSGLSQAVMWMHGVALPRDSDLQAATALGDGIDRPEELRAGDLLYFAEAGERSSHVAISLGGSLFIHSALSNGGVDINDLAGDLPLDRRLRSMFTSARRVLPD